MPVHRLLKPLAVKPMAGVLAASGDITKSTGSPFSLAQSGNISMSGALSTLGNISSSTSSFNVPTVSFTAGVASTYDLTQHVPGYVSGMLLVLIGTLPSSVTFNGTALVYDGTGGAVSVTGLVLVYNPNTAVPDYVAAMATYTVTKFTTVSNGKPNLNDTMPSDWIAANGTVGQNWNVMASYSGGAPDPQGRRLFFHGGGHSDSANNGIWYYDLNGIDKPTGFVLVDISAVSAIQDAETYSDGRPSSHHTYAGQGYDPQTDSLLQFFGSRWAQGQTPANSTKFDFMTGTWSTMVSNGDANPSVCIIDPVQRKCCVINHSGSGFFYRIDTNAKGGTFSMAQQNFDSMFSYDPTRNVALLQAPGQLWKVTINWSAETISAASQTLSGAASTACANRAPGMFYDSANDKHWLLPLTDSATSVSAIYDIDPTTLAFTAHTLSGVTSGFTIHGSNGLYNKIVYIPEWKLVGFATAIDDAFYGIRLP